MNESRIVQKNENIVSDGCEYQVLILHFDDTYSYQRRLCSLGHEIDLRTIMGTRFMCSWKNMKTIERLIPSFDRTIAFTGRGDFHYVTYLFLKRIREPFVLIVLDNHLDIKETFPHYISCGSWLKEAMKLPNVKRTVFVNSESINEKCDDKLQCIGFCPETIQMLVGDLPLYISIDKDVLHYAYVTTNWDQGSLSPSDIQDLISTFSREKILGIDLCGEPEGFNFFEHGRSEKINLAIVNILQKKYSE